ncbi:MAG: sulfatase-like hydrolase/transferase [Candidatus Magasanikbacteria bacterium]|nr:sulfatase-like hydrolase/transferase [Candidatus Magasanikbacteria bacterium]
MKISLGQYFFRRFFPSLYAIAGSFIIAAGWNWYHLPRRVKVWTISPHERFVVISLLTWAAVYLGYRLGVLLYLYLVQRFRRHPFWRAEFALLLDRLFAAGSLLFVTFFLRNELASLIYVSLVLLLFFWQLRSALARHPAAAPWLTVHAHVFALVFFIFLVQAAVQYASWRFYILDSNVRFPNIVVFRALAMSLFWLVGFAAGGWLFWKLEGWWRYLVVTLWSGFFVVGLFFWTVNVGVLYYSGLPLSPVALQHLRGGGEVVKNSSTVPLLSLLAVVTVGFVLVIKRVARAHRQAPARYWQFYQAGVIILALFAWFGLASFRTTPERAVAKSFYEYYFRPQAPLVLNPAVRSKLERFGLRYNPDTFYIAERPFVYSPTNTARLLPEKFRQQRPNIIIIFLESYSTRLTSVYSKRFPGLTPGLEAMAGNPDTTIFKKYYNASTPTVTGLLSQLCSFLPPTGHEEIQNERKLKRHRLLCLPEALHRSGYQYSAYITAVQKDFANKDGIFASMGTQEVYGTAELARWIEAAPKSWGYSDHQMLPALWQIIGERAREPFLVMLSTVDTHPPFNLAKDGLTYGDGKSTLLNAFRTTDDAFGKFWQEFQASRYATNTIVVAVGDHAVFPAAFTRDLFPAEAGKLTFYDENAFLLYVPDTVLPKEVDLYSSGLDFTPTLLQLLGINMLNSFEGHSIFDDRRAYPNLLGMHELGLYINQLDQAGKRRIDYSIPSQVECPADYDYRASAELTLCDYRHFYRWKRQMFEQGRFWKR